MVKFATACYGGHHQDSLDRRLADSG
jgi:hypothetical protein